MSHFTDFTGYVLFIITSFLAGVESTDQCLLNSKVLPCFSGVIISIRSFFLLNELNNSDNLKDGSPSTTLFTYHMTDDKDFTCFEPQTPQYRKLKNGEFTSLTLRITDQNNNVITDGLQVTVVLHVLNHRI